MICFIGPSCVSPNILVVVVVLVLVLKGGKCFIQEKKDETYIQQRLKCSISVGTISSVG